MLQLQGRMIILSYKSADLWEEKPNLKKFLISAGLNKQERPLYLSEYKDSDECRISTIPIPMSEKTAIRLIRRAEKQLEHIREKYPRKYPPDMTFKLVEFNDPYEGDLD